MSHSWIVDAETKLNTHNQRTDPNGHMHICYYKTIINLFRILVKINLKLSSRNIYHYE